MNTTFRLSTIAALALGLAGCGAKEFADEGEKLEAFETMICARTIDADETQQRAYAQQAAAFAMRDTDNQAEKQLAMDVQLKVMGSGAIETPPLTVSPDGDGTCHGWVFENYVGSRMETEYDDFTYQDAVDAGVYK